jgi:hypothetical protein
MVLRKDVPRSGAVAVFAGRAGHRAGRWESSPETADSGLKFQDYNHDARPRRAFDLWDAIARRIRADAASSARSH